MPVSYDIMSFIMDIFKNLRTSYLYEVVEKKEEKKIMTHYR